MSYQLGQIDPEERVDLGADEAVAEAAPRRRGLAATVLAVLVMAVFAGGLWFAYEAGTRHGGHSATGGVPLIQAETGPTKVKPAQPGGMVIPDRDKAIFNEKAGGPPGEELLAKPEPLLPRPAAATAAPAPTAPTPTAVTPTSPAPAAPAAVPALPPVAVAPEHLAPQHPTPQPLVVQHPAPEHPAPGLREPGKPVIPARKAERAKPAAAGAHVRIQLGAMRTPELARREWARLKRANPELLGHLSAVAVRADLGAKGVFYRIEAGPVGDAAAAQRLCHALKEHKSRCIIAH